MTTTLATATDARAPWRRVLIATPIGWAAGIVAGIALIVLAESVGIRQTQAPLVLGVALGVSEAQFRALRPVLAGARMRWLLASCLGLAGPFAVVDASVELGRALPYDLAAFVILGGILLSVLQWNVLRHRVGQAGSWLLASPAGYLAAASTIWLNERVLPKTPGIVGALQYLGVILAGGVLLGLLTGLSAARFELRVPPGADVLDR